MAIKETKDEFEGYLQEAKQGKQDEGEKEKNEEEEDKEEDDPYEDEDNEEVEYSPEEVSLVEKCVLLFSEVINFLKTTMKIITDTADALPHTTEEEQAQVKECQQWIAQVEKSSQELENQVVDLGAELYPPIDCESEYSPALKQFRLLQEKMEKFFQLIGKNEKLKSVVTGSELEECMEKFHSITL
jgi:actin-related protein